jgi:hypothetical protein
MLAPDAAGVNEVVRENRRGNMLKLTVNSYTKVLEPEAPGVRDEANQIESKLNQKLRAEMCALGVRLNTDPEGDPLIWPIRGQLACTRHPLRDHPDFEAYVYEGLLPAQAGPLVIAGMERILAAGICSVICLLPISVPNYNRKTDRLPFGMLIGITSES